MAQKLCEEGPALFKLLINWVHLFAAITWLGAIVYNAIAVESGSANWREGERLRFRISLGQAFSPAAWSALSALVISGLVKLHWHVEVSYPATLSTPWGRLLIGKWLIAALLVGLGATTRYLLLPGLERIGGTRNFSPTARNEATRLERLVTLCGRLSLALAAGLILVVIML